MMMAWWLLLLVLLVGAAAWLAQRGGPGGPVGGGEDRAEAILRERYARGEIDDETYHRQAEELRRS